MRTNTHNNYSEIVRTNTLMSIILEHFSSTESNLTFRTFTELFQNPKTITTILSVRNNSTALYNESVIENGSVAVRETPTLLNTSEIHRQSVIRCILIIDRMERVYKQDALDKMISKSQSCDKFMNLFKKVNTRISENIDIERLLFSSFELLRIYSIAKRQEPDFPLSDLCSFRVCYNVAKSVQDEGYRTMYFASLPGHSFNQFDMSDYSMNIEKYDENEDMCYHKTAVLLLMNAVKEAEDLIGNDLEFEESIIKGNIGKALSTIKDFITP